VIGVRGLVFAGTATDRRHETALFVERTLGLPRIDAPGVDADLFELPDGSTFAVASPRSMGETSRSIGFLVNDVDEALAVLAAGGAEPEGEVASNGRRRYVHVRFPDGNLYELIDERV